MSRPVAEITREHVAQACAYLNDVDLPNVYALASELKRVIALAKAYDEFAPVAHAELILSRIEPHLPANI